MKVTTYKTIRFKSGDIIPAGTDVEVLPIPHKTERRKSHPFKCMVLLNGKTYLCNYTSVLEPPSEEEIEDMVFESTCPSVNDIIVEPDGFDPEGFPSWLQALSLV